MDLHRWTSSQHLSFRFILAGAGLGALYWVIEAVAHAYLFGIEPFLQALLKPDTHELAMRSTVVGLLFCLGVAAEFALGAWRRGVRVAEEKERFLQNIFDGIQDGVSVLDTDFNILRVNAWMEKAHSDEVPLEGKKCYRAYQKRESICDWCPCAPTIETGRSHTRVVPVPHATAGAHWVELSAFPLREADSRVCGVIEHVKDVTERVRAEESLRESERRLRDLFENATDLIHGMRPDGRILYANHALRQLLAYESDALGEISFPDVIHPSTRPACEQALARLASGGQAADVEFVLVSKAGEETLVQGTWVGTLADGKVVSIQSMLHDVSEERRKEGERLQAQKLESVGILAGGIAHDFNNLLTGILGNISLAKLYAEAGGKVHQRLGSAEEACRRARDLTQQLLTFSKGGTPVKGIVSVPELVMEAAEFALRGSRSRADYSFPEDLWPVEVDQGQIAQVIDNIVINADQSMPDGGTIQIVAENFMPPEGSAGWEEGRRYVRLSVQDHGIGIPREHFQKVFDPYFSTKQKGSGLGLAVAYSVIKSHGGTIEVDSTPGDGSTFHVTLPAAAPGTVQRQQAAPGEVTQGHGRILLMDDEEMVRETAGEMLRFLGYETDFARDGAEAVEMYRRAMADGNPYGAVIMDLTIPGGMGGEKAVGKILEIDPRARAVVSSGYATDPIMADFRRWGFSGVVPKPYKMEELSRVLQEVFPEREKAP